MKKISFTEKEIKVLKQIIERDYKTIIKDSFEISKSIFYDENKLKNYIDTVSNILKKLP